MHNVLRSESGRVRSYHAARHTWLCLLWGNIATVRIRKCTRTAVVSGEHGGFGERIGAYLSVTNQVTGKINQCKYYGHTSESLL